MQNASRPLIFDGHNDVLLRLWSLQREDAHTCFLEGDGLGHLDFPRIRQAGFGGGLFAIFVPPQKSGSLNLDAMNTPVKSAGNSPGYSLPLPEPIAESAALEVVMQQAALLSRIEQSSNDQARICLTAADVRECLQAEKLAMVMHIEGAEAIDTKFYNLDVLYRAGLRSVGLVWSRPTVFGHGVPFRFPATPDTGDGLTTHGKALVGALNEYRMVIDLSHLNEKGFWDVARLSTAPLIATHSNAHVLCESSRNLTDEQLAAIRDSDGMVGVNFGTCFLRDDGRMRADTALDTILSQIDYLLEHVGEHRVGFGSDFDGAVVPAEMGDVTGLVALRDAMKARGYSESLLDQLCHENWLAALERTLGA